MTRLKKPGVQAIDGHNEQANVGAPGTGDEVRCFLIRRNEGPVLVDKKHPGSVDVLDSHSSTVDRVCPWRQWQPEHPEPIYVEENISGGTYGIRTRVDGFADRCVATPPRRPVV